MRVAIFSTKPYEPLYLDQANLEGKHQFTYFTTALNSATANLAAGYTAVSILLSDKIDKETIEKLSESGVKLIDLRSAGYDNVDIKAAHTHHMKVLRVPAYSPQAIAEHATALILTLNRKTHKAYNRVRENNFSVDNLMGFNLYGKTIGVVGTGNIGACFCTIMQGFGCHVIAYDIRQADSLKEKNIRYVSFDNLLKESDIISIHCPLTHATKYLFNDATFAKVKKGMMLINTSRGGIINTADAIRSLKNGQLGSLGLDVYEGEQNLFFKDLSQSIIQDDLIERLMSFNNVLITPHQAFFTKEAVEQIALITIKNFTDFELGRPLENEVKN
jgi:D-lactate dehydrogenase